MATLLVSAGERTIALDFDDSVPTTVVETVDDMFGAMRGTGSPDIRIPISMDLDDEPPATGAFARAGSVDELIPSIARTVDGAVLASFYPEAMDGRATGIPARVALQASALTIDDHAIVLFGGVGRHAVLRALAGTGALIGTDVATLDRMTLAVGGVPAPIRMDQQGASNERRMSPASAGLAVAADSHTLSAFVILAHDANGTSGFRTVSLPQSVALAAPALPYLSALERPLLSYAELLGQAPTTVISFQDAAEIPDLLRQALANLETTGWATGTERAAHATEAVPVIGDVRRAAMIDVITDGDHLAFYSTQHEVTTAEGISPLLWDLAADWISVPAMTERLVTHYGEPEGDPESLVSAAVDALVERGVLVRV